MKLSSAFAQTAAEFIANTAAGTAIIAGVERIINHPEDGATAQALKLCAVIGGLVYSTSQLTKHEDNQRLHMAGFAAAFSLMAGGVFTPSKIFELLPAKAETASLSTIPAAHKASATIAAGMPR